MEKREDGEWESVRHQGDAATETDAPRCTAPQQHAGSCNRAYSDLASGRNISSWLAATHPARALAATSSGAAGQDFTRAPQRGTWKEARELRWGLQEHAQAQLGCAPTCGAPAVIGQWAPRAVLAAAESDFRIPEPAH